MMSIPPWVPRESLVCSHPFSREVRSYNRNEWRTEPYWMHNPIDARFEAPRAGPLERLRTWLASRRSPRPAVLRERERIALLSADDLPCVCGEQA